MPSLSLSTPLSLYSIPAAWFIAFYPMRLKHDLVKKTLGSWNNVQPRANLDRLAKKSAEDPKIKAALARAERMEGANLNGNEILPLWVAGVIVGNISGIPQKTLNVCSIGFVVSRIAYNHFYINHTTQFQSLFRSIAWVLSVGFPMYLLIKGAGKVSVIDGIL